MLSIQNIIENEFNLRQNFIYLNHAAVSPWPLRTAKAVQAFADENLSEGSMHYPEWLKKETALRQQAALILNAQSSDDIALLKNTSEALSVVAYGLDWQKGDNIVSSDQEFPSNRIVWQSLASKGVEFREADLGSSISPEDALFSLVDEKTALITISSVQFGAGLRVDLNQIGKFCRERSILFCVDAIQSLGAIQFDVQDIHADFVMADGHKWMLGPEGLAIFYTNPESRDKLRLNQFGWHMVEDHGDFDRRDWETAGSARRFECGSPNMLGIHALHASLSLLLEIGMDHIEKEVLKRSKHIMDMINSQHNLDLISSDKDNRYAGIITFTHHNGENERLFQHLINNNIFCAFRSGGIRLSPHFYTPITQLDHVFDAILKYS
ncbi:MAG: aminotransferase class V-fold PLP-dependent enzyme [Nitrospiraceae bacterium]|nr:MAG: aminotransferase class V-fold PLP-dependent enzyme [Nitrospiraceae bacterium]